MNFNNISRHLAAGMMVGCLTISLFTGCTEKAKTGNDAGGDTAQPANVTESQNQADNAPAKDTAASLDSIPSGGLSSEPIPLPEREEVITEPTFTFTFGDKEAKGFELPGVDLTGKEDANKVRTSSLAIMKGDAYFYLDTKPKISLAKVRLDGETISDLTIVGDGYAINELTTNGDVVLFKDKDKILNVYDGKELKKGEKCHLFNPYVAPGSKDVYYMQGHKLKKATLDGVKITGDQDVVDFEQFEKENGLSVSLFSIEGGVIFLRSEIKKDGKRIPLLLAMNQDGNPICRFEGLDELPRDWAVTNNYVIHSGSKGNFRIYDKASGKLLGDAHVDNIHPFVLQTMQGNDVMVYDDRDHKLYRIDF